MGMLFLVLLVLKLTEVITWSWWIVTAPIWASAVVIVVAFVVSAYIVWKAHK